MAEQWMQDIESGSCQRLWWNGLELWFPVLGTVCDWVRH